MPASSSDSPIATTCRSTSSTRGWTSAETDAGVVAARQAGVGDRRHAVARRGSRRQSRARRRAEIDGGYTLTYQPSRGDDGRYHPVHVSLVRPQGGCAQPGRLRVAPVGRDAPRDARGDRHRTVLPTRLLRRSPLVDVWSGVTRATRDRGAGRRHVGAGPNFVGTRRSNAARVDVEGDDQRRKGPLRGNARRRCAPAAPDRSRPIAPSSTPRRPRAARHDDPRHRGREARFRRARSRGPGDEGGRRRCCCPRS